MTTRPYDVTTAYNTGYMGYQGYQGGYMGAGSYGATMGGDYMTTTACTTPYQLSPSRSQPPPTPMPDRYARHSCNLPSQLTLAGSMGGFSGCFIVLSFTKRRLVCGAVFVFVIVNANRKYFCENKLSFTK